MLVKPVFRNGTQLENLEILRLSSMGISDMNTIDKLTNFTFLDLHKNETDDPFIQEIISVREEFVKSKSEAGSKGVKAKKDKKLQAQADLKLSLADLKQSSTHLKQSEADHKLEEEEEKEEEKRDREQETLYF